MHKQIVTGNTVTNYEFTDKEWSQALQILAEQPLLEVMNELQNTMAESKKQINRQLSDLAARHGAAIHEKESVVNQARYDLQQADRELREANQAGKYSQASAIEAKRIEAQQAILAAEVELCQVQETAAIEKNQFLLGVSNGQLGSGAAVKGLEWYALVNIAKVVLNDYANNNMVSDVVSMVNQEARQANEAAHYSRLVTQDARQKLEAFKQEAQARYSGSGVKQSAAVATVPQDVAVRSQAEMEFASRWRVKQPQTTANSNPVRAAAASNGLEGLQSAAGIDWAGIARANEYRSK